VLGGDSTECYGGRLNIGRKIQQVLTDYRNHFPQTSQCLSLERTNLDSCWQDYSETPSCNLTELSSLRTCAWRLIWYYVRTVETERRCACHLDCSVLHLLCGETLENSNQFGQTVYRWVEIRDWRTLNSTQIKSTCLCSSGIPHFETQIPHLRNRFSRLLFQISHWWVRIVLDTWVWEQPFTRGSHWHLHLDA